ncbi:hypothetical protein F4818DRAFT_454019 [Hypoxylon cercidicola]|nr:hypothetical protein F4818DRAFT_454019 [Hypoxylon cercidicola]
MHHVRRGLSRLTNKDRNAVYGLQPQASASDNPDAYIIAIHGLMGNSSKTWTHKDGTLWLRDTLPSKLPNVKILSYGYRPDIFGESQNTLVDVARNLLEQLKIARTAQNKRKPIVFVCHDLGGIVFKKSIALAHEQDSMYGDILRSTKHAVFLGAPHGSEHAMWNFLHNLAAVSTEGTGLEKNVSEFAKINESFIRQSRTMGITSFYETQKTWKGSTSVVVADATSAKIGLPNEEPISLEEDHFTISKMKAGGNGIVEGAVVNIVRRVIQSQSAQLEPTQESMTEGQKKILNSLFLIGASNMVQNISEPVTGTCDWLKKDMAYMDWMSNHRSRGLLWVEGPVGYGKSVLARYLKTYLESSETDATVCSFFCDAAVENRNQSTAVIRMILYQLMSKTPSLARHALSMTGNRWLQDLPTLVGILEKCLQDPQLGNTYIIIDALNECKDDSDSNHIQWISKALKETRDSDSKLRIMLTSRQNSAILAHLRSDVDAYASSFVLRLERHASQMTEGVNRFIHDRVSKLNESHRIPEEDKTWLTEELERRSQGSFLWVSALLRNLDNSFGVCRGIMEKMLKIKPTNIQGLYSDMLGRVPLRDRNWAKSLLQAVVASYVPLTLSDLNWHSAAYQCTEEQEKIEDFIQPNFGHTLRNVLDGLVKVVDGVIYLEHITVSDFLTADPVGIPPWYHFTNDDAGFEMAHSCFLRLRSLAQTPDDCSLSQNLVMYALRFAARHIREVEHMEKPDFTTQVKSIYQNTNTFVKWRSGHIEANRMIARANMKVVIKTIAQNMPLATQDDDMLHNMEHVEEELLEGEASPIRAASFFGHLRVFEALLDEQIDRIDSEHPDGWTALCTAVERSQERMVEKLLEKQADIEKPAFGQHPLHFAASLQESTIAKILITHDADVNSVSKDGRTPLFSAAGGGCDSILDLLIEKGAKVEHRDNDDNTVLHIAMSKGHEKVIRKIVQKVDSTIKNKSEKTPLDLAPEARMEDVVDILLEELGAPTLMDRHGHLLHSATKFSSPRILSMLVRSDIILSESNKNAFSSLAPTTTTAVIRSFIDKGVDVDQTDTSGLTLLHKAAREDQHGVVQFLLENGADIEKTTPEGNTALHMAVSGEAHEVLRVLKQKKANVKARNNQEYTPFHWAVAEWRSKEILVILHSMNMEVETKNNYGDTPLQTAIRMQNVGLVEFLSQPQIGANLAVLTTEGYNVLDLAQVSFLSNLSNLTFKGLLGIDYHSYAYAVDHAFDDHSYQHDHRNVGEVMVDKTQMIQEILNMRFTPTSQLKLTIKGFKVNPVKEEEAAVMDERESDGASDTVMVESGHEAAE